ncbi:transporter [bacterium]|nr:transporter [bacterium]
MRYLIYPVLFILLTTGTALSQELVPRRWSHLPIGTNFAGAGYAFTRADITFDPVLKIEDAKLDMQTVALSYIRSFELLKKSARVDFKIPFQDGRWTGLLDGKPASAHRSGMADPVVRLAVNLFGGPPLKGKEFAKYRAAIKQETMVGVGLALHLPLGQYYEDKLLNLGSNRFTIRPQLGVVHQRGKWTGELTGSVWFFTDNDAFFNGLKREQDPFFTIQGHLIYTFHPGFWASMSGALGYGEESTVDHVAQDDTKRNVAWALGLGYSLTRQFGLKFTYVGIRNRSDTGADSDTLLMGISYFW